MSATCRLLNIDLLSITREELLRRLDRGVLITPNADILVKLQTDRAFYDCYRRAEWVICDSKVLYLLSKLTKHPLPMAIPGSSFFTAYYEYHKADADCRIFLLGAAEGVAARARARINERVGREIVVGAWSPSYGFEKDERECAELVRIVNASGANVLVVGVGAPKQEKWIDKYRSMMPGVRLFMALGATIDFEAGHVRRAPKTFQQLALEWFFRYAQEPKRLFRRYFIDDMKLFWYFAQQLIGVYRDPFGDTTNQTGGGNLNPSEHPARCLRLSTERRCAA